MNSDVKSPAAKTASSAACCEAAGAAVDGPVLSATLSAAMAASSPKWSLHTVRSAASTVPLCAAVGAAAGRLGGRPQRPLPQQEVRAVDELVAVVVAGQLRHGVRRFHQRRPRPRRGASVAP